ncbi:MAG: class I SAM-dependent methyltransferase [Candidatus Delongbacteria bacterium]|nr:class I SAM-dependent methyltransferase [Candidatus Delongbacteria bacterium]
MSPSSARRGSHADPYSLIASFYDRLMDHVDYPGWAALLERLCYRHGQRPPLSHFDAACGTGRLLAEVDGVGMEWLGGMDRSPQMLEKARQRLANLRPKVVLSVGDLEQDGPARPVELLSCLYDSVNYLTTPERLTRALHNLGSRLAPGGLLIFDVCTRANSVRHFNGRVENGRSGAFSWTRETAFDERTALHTNHFTIRDEQRGRQVKEVHTQRIYSLDEVRACCAQAGLQVLGCHGEFGLGPGSEANDRVHFVTRMDPDSSATRTDESTPR